MSPLAEQFAREIRDEVAGKINQRERMFDPEDGFIISKYVPPVKHPRHKKNVDHKRNQGFNNRAGKIKMAGRPAINHFRLRRSIRSKNKKPMHKIEIGDLLMYDGEWQMAFVVFEKQARVVQANGSVTIVNRKLNDIFIKQQLGASGLDNFLSGNNLKLDELIAKQEAKDDSNMKPKVKAKLEAGKNAAPRGGLAAEVAKRKAAEGGKAQAEDKSSPEPITEAKKAIVESSDEMKIHSLAELFPQIEGEEFEILVEDVKANGLREKITQYEDAILDGRNRFKACLKAGIDPEFENFVGTWEQAQSFVISKNIHRRHLTESQRAAIAAEISNTTHAGGDHSSNLPNGKKKVTNEQAAKVMKVSESSVRKAKKLKKESPELAKEVRDGKKSLHKASTEAGLVKEKPEALDLVEETTDHPKSSFITSEEFEIELAALEQCIPSDCDHKPFAVIATKFVQRQMAFNSAE